MKAVYLSGRHQAARLTATPVEKKIKNYLVKSGWLKTGYWVKNTAKKFHLKQHLQTPTMRTYKTHHTQKLHALQITYWMNTISSRLFIPVSSLIIIVIIILFWFVYILPQWIGALHISRSISKNFPNKKLKVNSFLYQFLVMLQDSISVSSFLIIFLFYKFSRYIY